MAVFGWKKTDSKVLFVIRQQEITLSYALDLIQKKAVLPVLHPALQELQDYDEKHDTELYETLYAFLENLH